MKPKLVRPLDVRPSDDAPSSAMPSGTPECSPRRLRNKICIRILALGAVNMLLYTLIYAALGGDAHNGGSRTLATPDGGTRHAFFVAGHYIRDVNGQEKEVSAAVWIYSYLHSISVWITSAAMILSMLVLARPHIVATMRHGWIPGETFVVAFGTIVLLLSASAVFFFSWDFISQLNAG